MAKRKKPAEPSFPAPLNMSENIEDMTAIASLCMSVTESPLIGTFTVLTAIGHYDFVIDEATANEMIQALREFLRGDSTDILAEKPD